jgi:hypothetical protein
VWCAEPSERPAVELAVDVESQTVAVGQPASSGKNEDSFALVRSANFRRSKAVARDRETHSLKSFGDNPKGTIEVG